MNKKTLPNSLLFLYGIGVSYAILDQIFVQWVLYYYLPPANSGLQPLIAPIFITIALVISRIIDVIFDPLVGFMSDNFKSKLGRRIPFILFGGLPLALCTVGFFYPPSFMRIEVYLPIIGSLFFIFYSIVGAPYNSLIPEISKSQADRVNLSTAQSVFRLLYTAIAMILPGYMIVKFGGGDTEKGLKLMVIALSVFSLVGMYTTGLFVKERKYSNYDKEDKHHHGFKESLKLIFANKQFKYYLLGLLFFFVGFNTLRTCINYYVEDIMGYGKSFITIASALLFGVSAICFYPVNRLSRKYGYRKPMLYF